MSKRLNRRQFLYLGSMSAGALILSACGANATNNAINNTVNNNVAEPSATDVPPEPTAAPDPAGEAQIIVGDVLDYQLTSDEWPGTFGSVTFLLHQGLHNGQPIYYIRTDASDPTFAEDNGLVYVPLLNAGGSISASLYQFDGDQPPVLSTSPNDPDTYIPLFHIKNVTVNDDSVALDSAEAVESAAADGAVTIEDSNVFVNYPVVKWAEGELPLDTAKDTYLGTGQLLEPVDTDKMTVTFKLHECYPGSRYIVTDTSAAPMAPMMSISAASPVQQLIDLGGTDEIWVFANGVPGSGVMGFQPAVFDNQAGTPAWSPFWNHFTWKWADGVEASVITTSKDGRDAEGAGNLELFNGTPDSHPNGFVVNCPVPILAPNTFEA